MTTVAAFEAKARFGELLDRVIAGEEIISTRQEKPVARIVPEGGVRLEQVQRAAAGLVELQQAIGKSYQGKSKISWEEFKSLVEGGRR